MIIAAPDQPSETFLETLALLEIPPVEVKSTDTAVDQNL
jgi:hypothetical protein